MAPAPRPPASGRPAPGGPARSHPPSRPASHATLGGTSRHGAHSRRKRPLVRRLLEGALALSCALVATYFGLCLLLLALYKVVYPPTTGVHLQRRLEALADGDLSYSKHYDPVSLDRISRHLPHAVVAAEDGRFYQHGGIDFEALQDAREQAERRGRPMRGASTITQQLVKNLFMTTHRLVLRKAFEVPLTLAAEGILGKDRILDLYVNVVEFGPGVFGAEAAARHHYGRPAGSLTRTQSATLAALLPNPHARTPRNVGWYRRIILRRMRQLGW
ncbi:MAG TPA: monofunctional biosynthetic peptidoglycan transglycosylase [Rhodothermales bacterium]|nr:monofunctional biosynthetic peptidoglycan transglycosylase [Rhodothermales bacterium]